MSYITYIIILPFFCISCYNYCILLCSVYTELLHHHQNNNKKLQIYGMVANKAVLRTAYFLLYQFDMLCAWYISIHAYCSLLYIYHVCRKQNVDSVLIKKKIFYSFLNTMLCMLYSRYINLLYCQWFIYQYSIILNLLLYSVQHHHVFN